jgi:L-galactono-1,4-lactone dehydrogenase
MLPASNTYHILSVAKMVYSLARFNAKRCVHQIVQQCTYSAKSKAREANPIRSAFGYVAAFLGIGAVMVLQPVLAKAASELEEDNLVEITNWSGTHTVSTRRYHQPESIDELKSLVKQCHEDGCKLRVVGSAISPNGLGLSSQGMVSMASLNDIISVDPTKKQVVVQAGARVDQVVAALRPYNLTLANYASIREQQIGGYTQTGAHGTGAGLSSVDEQVVGMELLTPALGSLQVSPETDPELFYLARVGLGALGIATTITLQCVDAHRLTEETLVLSHRELQASHDERLRNNQHVRYMWLPYTDKVVVVQCNPTKPNDKVDEHDPAVVLAPLRNLLQSVRPDISIQRAHTLSFADLRDELLKAAPLDLAHVQRVNAAEAEFWERSTGVTDLDWSDQVLGFECGGQQWVNEVALPTGTLANNTHKDLNFVYDLLELIEKHHVPAPCPIEQRWTARSASPMAHSHRAEAEGLTSWVGIIMYLCDTDDQVRKNITQAFQAYRGHVAQELDDRYNAFVHWAKLEVPDDVETLASLRLRLHKRFPVEDFNAARTRLDPKGILSNAFVETLFD